MDKQLKRKKALIETLFKFLKIDFTTLDPTEKQAIINEMLTFFYANINFEGKQIRFANDIVVACEAMRSYVGHREERAKLERELMESDLLTRIQSEVKTSLNGLMTKERGEFVPALATGLIVRDGLITNAILPGRSPDFLMNIFLSNVHNILQGIPLNFIKICPNCGGYFVNPARRRKEYCSPSCTWKALARKRREELKKHPRKYKAYLKKQKEIMRRKYEERRKAELGPNVKVKRRKEG